MLHGQPRARKYFQLGAKVYLAAEVGTRVPTTRPKQPCSAGRTKCSGSGFENLVSQAFMPLSQLYFSAFLLRDSVETPLWGGNGISSCRTRPNILQSDRLQT